VLWMGRYTWVAIERPRRTEPDVTACAATTSSCVDSTLSLARRVHRRVAMQTLAAFGRRTSWAVLILALGFAVDPARLAAQDPASTVTHATRAELERLADESERALVSQPVDIRDRKRAEVALLRERLREGDFHAGDRIVLRVRSDSAMTDTFVVRSGGVLELRTLPPISLRGVLRSELESHLTKEIARYLRDPHVEATSLIRVAVLGEVIRPGFFAMAADVLVSDAIMVAGGPSPTADVSRITIRRGAADLVKADEVRAAIVQGRTLDQLNLRAGDEIVVGERKRRSFSSSMSVISGIVAIAVGVLAVSR
jgi:protein involved in polysaccharide export with SLBB domain